MRVPRQRHPFAAQGLDAEIELRRLRVDDHPQAELVKRQMAGGSNLIAFEVPGGRAGAFKVANAFRIIRISNNLGDAKSLVTHPSTTTHQRFSEAARREQGITQGLLRLSVGLEDVDDLAEDLDHALAKLGYTPEHVAERARELIAELEED